MFKADWCHSGFPQQNFNNSEQTKHGYIKWHKEKNLENFPEIVHFTNWELILQVIKGFTSMRVFTKWLLGFDTLDTNEK